MTGRMDLSVIAIASLLIATSFVQTTNTYHVPSGTNDETDLLVVMAATDGDNCAFVNFKHQVEIMDTILGGVLQEVTSGVAGNCGCSVGAASCYTRPAMKAQQCILYKMTPDAAQSSVNVSLFLIGHIITRPLPGFICADVRVAQHLSPGAARLLNKTDTWIPASDKLHGGDSPLGFESRQKSSTSGALSSPTSWLAILLYALCGSALVIGPMALLIKRYQGKDNTVTPSRNASVASLTRDHDATPGPEDGGSNDVWAAGDFNIPGAKNSVPPAGTT